MTDIKVGDLGYMKHGDTEIKVAVVLDQMQEGKLNLMRRMAGISNDLVWVRLGMGIEGFPDPEVTRIVGHSSDWYGCHRWLFDEC